MPAPGMIGHRVGWVAARRAAVSTLEVGPSGGALGPRAACPLTAARGSVIYYGIGDTGGRPNRRRVDAVRWPLRTRLWHGHIPERWLPGPQAAVRLVDVPLDTAQTTGRWLRALPATPEHPRDRGHRMVLAGQVRELTTALLQNTAGLVDVTAHLIAATPRPRRAGTAQRSPSTSPRHPPGIRRAADTLSTIEDLERTTGIASRSVPTDARGLVAWIADEIDKPDQRASAQPVLSKPPTVATPMPAAAGSDDTRRRAREGNRARLLRAAADRFD